MELTSGSHTGSHRESPGHTQKENHHEPHRQKTAAILGSLLTAAVLTAAPAGATQGVVKNFIISQGDQIKNLKVSDCKGFTKTVSPSVG